MLPTKITSTQHPIVKRLVSLRKDKSFRETENSALVVGFNLISDLSAQLEIKTLIFSKEFPSIRAQTKIYATEEILKKITALASPEGIAAEVTLPPSGNLLHKKSILVLDALSDPGNVGTLLRTALALGWEGVFLTPGTADPFSEKAIRAAKGASFLLPLQAGSIKELEEIAKKNKAHLYVADLEGENVCSFNPLRPCLLILGNESQGPSLWARKNGKAISIPMEKKMESLNVASAGAILMFILKT